MFLLLVGKKEEIPQIHKMLCTMLSQVSIVFKEYVYNAELQVVHNFFLNTSILDLNISLIMKVLQ